MKHQLFAGIATGITCLALTLAPIGAVQAQEEAQATNSAQQSRTYDLGAGDLGTSLDRFAEQNGFQIGYPPDLVAGKSAPALRGQYSARQALDRLLAGSGLEAEFVNDRAIVLRQTPAATGDTIGQRQPGIEEIIVTGQKREERIQDVPIAISAFSPEDLEAQKIEGGFDLLKAVPNVTFSKTNFSGYNFQIRGIGTQAVSASTDPAVAVSFNNTTLIVNRLFEQEYLDVERVEVLRGPQGTLFGRNATAGVINVISSKPEMGVTSGMIDVEVGNYNARRLRGHFNVPLGDDFALRGAYASTKRDGFGINEGADNPLADVQRDVDDRDLWTGRLTLGWQPTDRFRANLIWERFEEDDRRVRTSKQLCHRDESPTEVDGHQITTINEIIPAQLSQGCEPGSLFTPDAFQTPNGASLPSVVGLAVLSASVGGGIVQNPPPLIGGFGFNPNLANPRCDFEAGFPLVIAVDVCNLDPYGGLDQTRDLRTIESLIEPRYQASANIYEFSFDYEFSDNLTFTSQTVYADDEYSATQDYNRFTTIPVFGDSAAACDFTILIGGPCNPGTYLGGFFADVTPGGEYDDPQFGPAKTLVAQDLSRATSEQFNQEFRLVSSYGGPWNFSLGANFTQFETLNDYFVFSNTFSLISHLLNVQTASCRNRDLNCVYIDPNPLASINGEGHNYFRSQNPYELDSSAVFGELYWQATDTIKVTAGLRMSWDRKVFTPIPSQLLLTDYREAGTFASSGRLTFLVPPGGGPELCTKNNDCQGLGNAPGGRGYVADPRIIQEWREPTGRLVVDWAPNLTFTDESMVYGSYSRGYKGGGANPPGVAPPSGNFITAAASGEAPATFDAEYVDAFEVGSKNTLFGGALMLNASAFYYDYDGYQVSKIVDRRAINENYDAELWGLELESLFAPTPDTVFNAAIGYLRTRIANGEESIDLMDRTQGNPDWMVVKPWIFRTSNCIAPTVLVRAFVEHNSESANLGQFCLGGGGSGNDFIETGPVPGTDSGLIPGTNMAWEDYPGYDEDFGGVRFDPAVHAPNAGSGFMADLSGNELPNSPRFTVALGAQQTVHLPAGWSATGRVDFYWQDESYHRVYNTEYDRLKSWTNTNFSLWAEKPEWGLTVEAYLKNAFDETPVTGAFLNSDDSGLTTNVFTLDPRLVGVSIRKEF